MSSGCGPCAVMRIALCSTSGRLSGFAELGKGGKVLDELYGGSNGSVSGWTLGWLRLWPWRLLLSSLYDAPGVTPRAFVAA